MNFSLAQAGVYVTILSFIFQVFKINIATEEVTSFVEAALTIVGLAMAWYGRYRKGDLTKLGFRKPV